MTAQSIRERSTRRASRHPRVSRLIAVDEHSLAEAQALLATLPLCATGRVFVEVADAGAIGVLQAPPRMTVTWLDRSRRSGAMGSGLACGRGQALIRAVNAWSTEMLCDGDAGTRVHLLTDYLAAAEIHEHLTSTLDVPAESVHAPSEYQLNARS